MYMSKALARFCLVLCTVDDAFFNSRHSSRIVCCAKKGGMESCNELGGVWMLRSLPCEESFVLQSVREEHFYTRFALMSFELPRKKVGEAG